MSDIDKYIHNPRADKTCIWKENRVVLYAYKCVKLITSESLNITFPPHFYRVKQTNILYIILYMQSDVI